MRLFVNSDRSAPHALLTIAALPTLLLVVFVGGCAAPRKSRSTQEAGGKVVPRSSAPASWRSLGTIHLDGEKPGLRLDIVVTPNLIPSFVNLRATYPGKIWLVRDLNELRGLLLINNAATALKYVRLGSGPVTGGFLSGGYEVVDLKAFRCNPDWDGTGRGLYGPWHSGLQGVLSESAFRAGGFSPPRVHKTADGFVIERWVFLWNLHPSVQRIGEFVGRDGAYRRVVVSQKPPPRLPGTSWNAIGLK